MTDSGDSPPVQDGGVTNHAWADGEAGGRASEVGALALHESFRILLWGDVVLGSLFALVGLWALAFGIPHAVDGIEILLTLGLLGALGGGWMLVGAVRALRTPGVAQVAHAGVAVAAGGALVAGLPGGVAVGAMVLRLVSDPTSLHFPPDRVPMLVALVAPTFWWCLHVLVRLSRRPSTRAALVGVGLAPRVFTQLRLAWPVAVAVGVGLGWGWFRRPATDSLPADDAPPVAWANAVAREETLAAAMTRFRKDPNLSIRTGLALQERGPGLGAFGVNRIGPPIFGPLGVRFSSTSNPAVFGLTILDEAGPAGRAEIVRLLNSGGPTQRLRVLEYLARRSVRGVSGGDFFPGGESAVAIISAACASGDPTSRRSAVSALRWFGGPAIVALGGCLAEADTGVRGAAVESLGWIARQDASMRELVVSRVAPLLSDSDPDTRAKACRALAPCGALAASCVPSLESLLAAAVRTERLPMLELASAIGPAAARLLPAVRTCLTDSNRTVRLAAGRAVWTVGRDADAAVPVLVTDVLDRMGSDASLKILLEIERAGADALGPLLAHLDAPDSAARKRLAWRLGRIRGDLPPRVRDALLAHREDPDRGVQRAIADALERLGAGSTPR